LVVGCEHPAPRPEGQTSTTGTGDDLVAVSLSQEPDLLRYDARSDQAVQLKDVLGRIAAVDVEVWFHDASRHVLYYVVDQEGNIPWREFPHRRTVVGAANPTTIGARRRQVLGELVPLASASWLPVLTDWLSSLA
jgi:hypothetical protein